MKAINCTQCGATIDDVSERSVMIDCDYCGARIMLDARQHEQPKPRPVQVEAPGFEPTETTAPAVKLIAVVVGLVFLVPIVIGIVGLSSRRSESTSASTLYSAPSTPYPYPTPTSWSVSTEVPDRALPVVTYEPRMSWEGPNDNEHFEDPEIDFSKVSHLTVEEVKKTVFKNRVVKLRVVIKTDGEIDDVKTISGHPLLVEAATESAKRSVFNSRSKPTTRILTYTFRVLKD